MKKEVFLIEEKTKQVYDRVFKRIFSLSNVAIINLINGLFDKDFPLDSKVAYPNKEFIGRMLEKKFADVIVIINESETFHLEAQMTKDKKIVLRAFEYGFYYAVSEQEDEEVLKFPEPMIIYLDDVDEIPKESVLHISFGEQGMFTYRVRNYIYQKHQVAELNRKRMIVLIPFQVLKLRELCNSKIQKEIKEERFAVLQEEIRNDIIESIKANLQFGNITADDANQLLELTNFLYEHIQSDFVKSGGRNDMKPLLPGAIELPNDKYRIRIDELEKEISKYADENAKYADENEKLKRRIAELEKRN